MIEPTSGSDPFMNSGMRQTLADFEYYDICQGQAGIGAIGYSPLPVNLVEAAFGQIQKLQQADPSVDLTNLNITTCNNPTFVPGQPNTNYLAQIAPLPPACDKQGAGPCAAGVTPNGIGPTPTSSGTASAAAAAASASSSATGGGTAAGGTGGSASTTGSTESAASTQAAAASSTAAAGTGGLLSHGSNAPVVDGTDLAASQASSFLGRLAPWAVLPLLVLFAVPMVVGYRRARRRGSAADAVAPPPPPPPLAPAEGGADT
jgi:hypothetical protein